MKRGEDALQAIFRYSDTAIQHADEKQVDVAAYGLLERNGNRVMSHRQRDAMCPNI